MSLRRRDGWGEEEKKRAGKDGNGKRGLCHITCGSLAVFAVLWFWLNKANVWTILKAIGKIIV